MSTKVFRESLEVAVKDLTEAIDLRDELETRIELTSLRIENLRGAIRGLSALCGIDYEAAYPHLLPPDPDLEQGITDKVRRIFLEHAGDPFSAVEVRSALREKGFQIDRYSNALATIHTVLRRLHKAGELKKEDKDGKAYYSSEYPF